MTGRALLIFLVICQITLAVLSEPLLKVPKVYNALITSDQNLAPSRAYPVIQPVVHRTAIGYSPPFYYQPGVPAYAADYAPTNYAQSVQSSAETSREAESMESEKQLDKPSADENRCKTSKPSKAQAPLSFYPNFKSTYYDPYFYGFNVYPAFPTPGNYYFNYQPQGYVPSEAGPGYDGYQGYPYPGPPQGTKDQAKEDGEETKKEEKTEKVPDVPPPPLPARRSVKGSS